MGDGVQSPAAGVEFHRQRDQLEYQGKSEAGDAQVDEEIGKPAQGGKQQTDEDQGHGQLGAEIGQRDDGGPELDGGVALGVLYRVSGFVAGNANGGGGGTAVHIVRQPDHIGSGIIMVVEVAADVLDPHPPHTVGCEHSGGGIRTGDSPPGMLGGVFFEGAVHMGTGPEGQQQAGQDQIHIGPVKPVVIIWHKLLLSGDSRKNPRSFLPDLL